MCLICRSPCLQVTGDVLTICTDIGGPVLPGFGPTVFAEKAMVPTGIAAANAPAAAAAAVGSVGVQAGEGASLPQAVVDFLMPPQARNPDSVSQVGSDAMIGYCCLPRCCWFMMLRCNNNLKAHTHTTLVF